MTALTAGQISKLNKSNRAAKDGALGTRLAALDSLIGFSGSYTVLAAEASASRVVITSGLDTVRGFMADVTRSGSNVTHRMKFTAGSVAGTYVVSGSNVPGIFPDDVITYLGWSY